MSATFPEFYRIWFTIIDPTLALIGILANLFAPSTTLNSYSASFTPPAAIETIFLLDTKSAFLAGLIYLQIVLLRAKPTDLVVWRAVQMSILLVDLGMLGGFARAFSVQGRTDLRVWRAEEWTDVGITATVAAIRTAFCLNIGMGGQEKSKTI